VEMLLLTIGTIGIDLFRFLSVAVVRNDANINYPADLRGKVSCHTGYGRTAGWYMPIPRVSPRSKYLKLCVSLSLSICLSITW
jgi:hypothetical protein